MSSLTNFIIGLINGMVLFWPTVPCIYIFYSIVLIGNRGGRSLKYGFWKWRAVVKTTYVLHLLVSGLAIAIVLIADDPMLEAIAGPPIPLFLGIAAGTYLMYRLVSRNWKAQPVTA